MVKLRRTIRKNIRERVKIRKGLKMEAAPHTVVEAIIDYGVNNAFFFEGITPAKRIKTYIFGDDFKACMEKLWMR